MIILCLYLLICVSLALHKLRVHHKYLDYISKVPAGDLAYYEEAEIKIPYIFTPSNWLYQILNNVWQNIKLFSC